MTNPAPSSTKPAIDDPGRDSGRDPEPPWSSRDDSPFHVGERFIQDKLGVREQMENFGRRIIRDHFPEQHRAFYAQLPFITVGHVDDDGWPWASILVGRPGFIATPDARSMQVKARPMPGDPLGSSLTEGRTLGMVGVELATRRRNRLTGRVRRSDEYGFTLDLDQSFGNCPQYIQTRDIEFVREPDVAHDVPAAEPLERLDQAARAMIAQADTFFVASASATGQPSTQSGGADASHRGGRPGFVGIAEDEGGDVLIIPDYSGNNHFNTLGNFVVNPRAGLLFVDFERGHLLMLSGSVEIVWDGPEVEAYRGAERLWKFRLERGLRLRDRLAVRWRYGEMSPNNELTGTWQESRATLEAEAARDTWRPYRVRQVIDESAEIRSFWLEPDDGGGLPLFQAGQHVPIRVALPSEDQDKDPDRGQDSTGFARKTRSHIRTYTVSSAPGEPGYRISVKRESEGTVSRFLHDAIHEGDIIEARAPRGRFTFDASEQRPAVLLAGGVGITPMISMLRHAVREGLRTRYTRPTTLIHAARTTAVRAFFDEARQLEAAAQGRVRVVSIISQPESLEQDGGDVHHRGRISRELLRQLLGLDDHDFYLCGPGGFMQASYDALRDLGVRDARIHAEAFGPSALERRGDEGAGIDDVDLAPAADSAIVEFGESGFEMPWTPGDGSLLELAERHGLEPAFSCRGATCGTCAVAVCSGDVTYPRRPEAEIPEGQALICTGVPAASDGEVRVVLDL